MLKGDIEDGFKEWPEDLHKALTTNGFARELRDLILRASERGIDADELAALGKQEGEKYWEAAAAFWKRYLPIPWSCASSAHRMQSCVSIHLN